MGGNCSTLTVNWNKTLLDVIDDLAIENSISANYTMTVLNTRSLESWRAKLSASAMLYRIPDQLVTDRGEYFVLQLQIEILLLNNSHLHLSSPLQNISAPRCDSE